VHGRPDGLLMTQLVEQIVMNNSATSKIQSVGVLMRSRDNVPVLQPLYKVQRDTGERIVRLMNELGFSPQGRLKFAPPMGAQPQGIASWDDIDS
jgi:P27 family predicted phage terminase small subunit